MRARVEKRASARDIRSLMSSTTSTGRRPGRRGALFISVRDAASRRANRRRLHSPSRVSACSSAILQGGGTAESHAAAVLTRDEVIAVRLYSGPAFQPINNFLRQLSGLRGELQDEPSDAPAMHVPRDRRAHLQRVTSGGGGDGGGRRGRDCTAAYAGNCRRDSSFPTRTDCAAPSRPRSCRRRATSRLRSAT